MKSLARNVVSSFFFLVVFVVVYFLQPAPTAEATTYASSTGAVDYVGIFSTHWSGFLDIGQWQVSSFPFNNGGISTLLKNPLHGGCSIFDEVNRPACELILENSPDSYFYTGEEVDYKTSGNELTLSQIYNQFGLGDYLYFSNNCGFSNSCGFRFTVTSSTTALVYGRIPSFSNLSATTSYKTRITNVEITQELGGGFSVDASGNVSGGSYYFVYSQNNSGAFTNNSTAITDTGEDSFNLLTQLFSLYPEVTLASSSFYAVRPLTIVNSSDCWNDAEPLTVEDCKATTNDWVEWTDGESVSSGDPAGFLFTADYYLDTTEIVSTISEKNPTMISFSLSKRPTTTTETQGELINNTVSGTGTVSTTFTSLVDGTYDVLVKFSNVGCSTSLSKCPFPLSYVYSSFVVSGGLLESVATSEVYDNTVIPSDISKYEECGLTNVGGCINNSFRFLFIPSQESVSALVQTKNSLERKIPFVYVSDIKTVVDEVFNTEQAQTLDVELDLGFGVVPFINEEMIANAPQVNLIRTLLSYMLWITFAFGVYRMALNIHNKETV